MGTASSFLIFFLRGGRAKYLAYCSLTIVYLRRLAVSGPAQAGDRAAEIPLFA
jgi:hypothetical protein